MSTCRRSRNLTIGLVEDAEDIYRGVKEALSWIWMDKVDLEWVPSWQDFKKKWQGSWANTVDLLLVDMNLADRAPSYVSDATTHDGLRVYGYIWKCAPHVPCVLYTAHDLAEMGLDQFDDRDRPLYVVKKAYRDDHYPVISAARQKLGQVAEAIIWNSSREQRVAAQAALGGGEDPGALEVLDHGDRPAVLYNWPSLLMAMLQQTGEAGTTDVSDGSLANLLDRFQHQSVKVLLLTRAFKAADFAWQGSFGLSPIDCWLDEPDRTPLEACLHINNGTHNCDRSRWLRTVDHAVKDLALLRGMLAKETRCRLEPVQPSMHKATHAFDVDVVDEDAKIAYLKDLGDLQGPTKKALTELDEEPGWAAILSDLGIRPDSLDGADQALVFLTYYAEWEIIRRGIRLVLDSREEAVPSDQLGQPVAQIVRRGDDVWTLRLVLRDDGPGIRSVARIFRPARDASGHHLQRAHAHLQGYCRWAVLTSTGPNANEEWDAYASSEPWAISWFTADERRQLSPPACATGTTHVLEFDNPLPVHCDG